MNSNTKKRLSALEGSRVGQDETRIIIRQIVSADGKQVEPTRLVSKADGRIWDRVPTESHDEFEARAVSEIERSVRSGVVCLRPESSTAHRRSD